MLYPALPPRGWKRSRGASQCAPNRFYQAPARALPVSCERLAHYPSLQGLARCHSPFCEAPRLASSATEVIGCDMFVDIAVMWPTAPRFCSWNAHRKLEIGKIEQDKFETLNEAKQGNTHRGYGTGTEQGGSGT